MYFLSFFCTGRLTQIWTLKEMGENHNKALLHIFRKAKIKNTRHWQRMQNNVSHTLLE